jgi:hypothetical protein
MTQASLAIGVCILSAITISFTAAVRRTGWIFPGLATLVVMFFATAIGTVIGNPVLVSLVVFLALFAWVILRKNEAQLVASGQAPAGFKKCPACAEVIRAEATKCRFCSTDQATSSSSVA